MCHRCEARLEPVPGRPRDKRCPKCGDVNRDENASKNLERVFLEWVRVRQRPEYLRRPGEVALKRRDSAFQVSPATAAMPLSGTGSPRRRLVHLVRRPGTANMVGLAGS